MANMEFCLQNYLDTPTLFTVSTNTDTVDEIFDRFTNKPYQTSGYTGATTATILVSFGLTTSISRIFIQGHNMSQFRVWQTADTTTNYLTLTGGAATTTSNWSTNSETSHFLQFSTIQATGIGITMVQAITTSSEKRIGELVISDLIYRFVKNPSGKGYDPQIHNKQIVHQMSDGGVVTYDFADKYSAVIKDDYITLTERNDIKRLLYDRHLPAYFLQHPTGTSWDGQAYDTNWVGVFDGFKPNNNNLDAGWEMNFRVEETPA